MYRSVTPDRVFRSPCSSRPPTPPSFSNTNRSTESLCSRPQTPTNARIDENYNSRRDLDEPRIDNVTRVVTSLEERNGRRNVESSEETLVAVSRALREDADRSPTVSVSSEPRKSVEEQQSPDSPPTPTPEDNTKSTVILVS